jgi:glutamate--cysteine ligase
LHALLDRGVEYVEVRCMDLDPFEPIGIGAATGRFLDLFLLHCLLAESPPDTPREIVDLDRNQQDVSERGRTPGLVLRRGGREVALAEWGGQLLEELAPIAVAMDAANRGDGYEQALRSAHEALSDPTRLPSARVLDVMNTGFDGAYVQFIGAQSRRTKQVLLEAPWDLESGARFARLCEESIAAQAALEAADRLSFEEYLQRYLAPRQLTG